MLRTYNLTAGNYRITAYINDYVDWWLYDPDGNVVENGIEGQSSEFTVPQDGEYTLEYIGSAGFRLEREEQEEVEVTDIYSQPSIVPAAVSSELDNHGEERIHIAPYIEEPEPQPQGPSCTPADFTNWDAGVYLSSALPTLYEGESVYIDHPIAQGGTYYEGDLVISFDEVLGDIPAGSYPGVALVTEGGYMGCLDLVVRYPEG